MSNQPNTAAAKPSRSVLFGAAFLMATSAIGPGFLTQTSTFTAQHGAALALVIVLAIIMDIQDARSGRSQQAAAWSWHRYRHPGCHRRPGL